MEQSIQKEGIFFPRSEKGNLIALLIQEMRAGFALMEKRFEAIDKRFEAIDKRFEDLIHYMDKRFEDMNKRFALLQWFMVIGFSMLAILISALKFFA